MRSLSLSRRLPARRHRVHPREKEKQPGGEGKNVPLQMECKILDGVDARGNFRPRRRRRRRRRRSVNTATKVPDERISNLF